MPRIVASDTEAQNGRSSTTALLSEVATQIVSTNEQKKCQPKPRDSLVHKLRGLSSQKEEE